MSVEPCRFCAGEVSNRSGWPVCRRCYDGGRYYRWVIGELADDPGDAGLLRAYAFLRNDDGLMAKLGRPDPPPGLGAAAADRVRLLTL